MSTEEYIELCKENYAQSISGYNLIETHDTSVNDRKAIEMIFESNYDGIGFKTRQISLVYGGMIYSITYTATAERYADHIDDVDKIISEFTFR